MGIRRQEGPKGIRRQVGSKGIRRQEGPKGIRRQEGPKGIRRQCQGEEGETQMWTGALGDSGGRGSGKSKQGF